MALSKRILFPVTIISIGLALFSYQYFNKSEKNFTLQLLHTSDSESSFVDSATLEPKIIHFAKIVSGLRQLAPEDGKNAIFVTAGDHTLPGPFYEAASHIQYLGANGTADIQFFNYLGLTANGIGNHEFDGGINDFAKMLHIAKYPFISANLDFSKVKLKEGTPPIRIGEDGGNVLDNAGKIVKSAYVEVNGEKIGLIGRAPADFFNVVKGNGDLSIEGLDFFGGRDSEHQQPLQSALDQVLEQVRLLESKGINKIVLLDHAQDYTSDPLSAEKLQGIDVVVTAGSTGFMGGLNDGAREGAVFNTLREGDKPTSAYPLILKDRDAHPVVVVNTDQQYTYVGHLLVTFDKDGHITTIDPKSGPVATDAKTIANLETLLGHSIVLPEAISTIFADLQNTAIIKDMFSVVGITEDTLNGRRADVRSRETNLARLLTDSVSWHINQTYPDTTFDGILISGGSIRDYIRTPNITKFGLASAFAFDNKFTLIELSAEQFLAALENGVSRAPKRDGRFPQIAGFHIEYDLNKPGISDAITLTKPSRLKSVKLVKSDGTNEVLVEDFSWVGEPTRTFKIVTNQYLATGADGYRAFETAANTKGKFIEDTKGERAIVADYIQHELKGKVNLKDPIDQPRLCPVE